MKIRRTQRSLFALLTCALIVAEACGGEDSVRDIAFSEDYVLRVWDLGDGLRDNHIGSIGRDQTGYLWLTGLDGLCRFDGTRFVQMDDLHISGMNAAAPTLAIVARDGSLWITMERGGVGRIRDGRMETVLPCKPPVSLEGISSSLAEGLDGAVWVGANEEPRITRFHRGAITVFGPREGVPVGRESRVCVAGNGKVWIATTGGCAVFDGDRFQLIDPNGGDTSRPVLARSHSGGMWSSRGGKLLKYDDAGTRREELQPGWFRDISQINALLEDEAGTLWIGTLDSGLFCHKDGRFARVPTSFDDIFCLAEDGEGNLWCGTWGGGLNRLSPRRFFMRQIQRDLPGEVVRSLLEDAKGRLWAVGRYGRIVRAEEADRHLYRPVERENGDWKAIMLCAAPDSEIWIGTPRGLELWDPDTESEVATAIRQSAASLMSAPNGDLWVGTESGPLLNYRQEQVQTFEQVPRARAMAVDRAGRLWVGTEYGELFTKLGDEFRAVPVPLTRAGRAVTFIVPDEDGSLWIGILQGGLYRYRDGSVRKVPDFPNGALTLPHCLIIEAAARSTEADKALSSAADVFWIGTATGLLRTTRGVIERALDDGEKIEFQSIGANEGIPHAEFAMGYKNGAIRSRDGRLLFGTNLGLLELPPHALSPKAPRGRVVIEEALSGDMTPPLSPGKAWSFPPNPDVVRLRFTLPELGAPEQARFRYRLRNGESESRWIDVGRQREITVVQPAPGTYRFEVTAAVGEGPWLSPPASVDFTVRATWWQTPVFRVGSIFLAVALLALSIRAVELQRVRARVRRLEQEHAVERERSRIARDMHDEVGANLTHIATTTRLAALEPAAAVGDHLREIATTARHTVESLDEIVWAVNPRNDTVAGTVEYICKFAAGFLSKAGIEPEIAIPDELPAHHVASESRHNLFLATKEAVNNIAKHARAKTARIEVTIPPGCLRLVITDDGRGFDTGTIDPFSNGLVNMRERLSGIGGRCAVEGNHAGGGVRVVFELPLPPAT